MQQVENVVTPNLRSLNLLRVKRTLLGTRQTAYFVEEETLERTGERGELKTFLRRGTL
jgi:hypothetical protein